MADTALSLKIEPDTYRCTWTLSKPPDQETWQSDGDVTLARDRQPTGGVYGRAPISKTPSPGGRGYSYASPQYFEYPILHGDMLNGRNVYLLDAQIRSWSEDRRSGLHRGPNATLDAWAAIVGRGQPTTNDVLVDGGVVQLSNLDAFANRPPIEEIGYPSEPFEDEDPTFRAKFRQDSYQVWSDDDAEVALEYRISADTGLTGYHFSLAFSPAVNIELSTPITIKDFFTSWVLPLHGLVSASTGLNEDITYWTCCPVLAGDDRPPMQRQFQVFAHGVTQEPYKSENKSLDRARASAIHLGADDGDSLLSLLRGWQRVQAEQNPILNTYDVQSLTPDEAPRARFLLLVQALEGLLGFEDRLGDNREKFLAKRQRIIDACENCLSETDLKFLNKRLPTSPYSLDEALLEMLRALPVNLEPELARSDLIENVIAQEDKVTTTVGALRHVRNKMSHGEKTFDP